MDKLVKNNKIILVGYSGHAFVVADALLSSKKAILGYCDNEEKITNPFNLLYLGRERDDKVLALLKEHFCFISIGDNRIRERVYTLLVAKDATNFINAIHPTSVVSSKAKISKAILISSNATINAMAEIGIGVICNTACIIEHECKIGDFSHIAPGATLAGNVEIGKRSFIGANAVVKQGVKIGNNVTVGAGSVVLKDIPDGITVVGNPARMLHTK